MRTIPEVIPDLEPRAPAEPVPTVRVRAGLPYQTLVLGRDDGDVTELTADCQLLRDDGLIENFVVCPRADGLGHYVSVCVTRAQALGLQSTNLGYRLFERSHVRAMTRVDLPVWARAVDGGPSHVFWGQEMPEDENDGL